MSTLVQESIMKELTNKIAIVTGSSRGIGAAIALRLAGQGAHILVHYGKSREAAMNVQQKIQSDGGKADLLQADFSNMDEIRRFFEQVDEILGGRKLDILVNNAAIPNPSNNMDIDEEQFEKLMRVNVEAPFFITKRAMERMNDGGRIINISSKASKTPHPQSGVYAMTKAALDTFTVQMASQLGPRKITVNAIAPGPILTDMNRKQFVNEEIRKRVENWAAMKGIGNPNDVAGVAAFLVSPDARWITGQWIEVSGGLGI